MEEKPCVSLNISCFDYTHQYVKIFMKPKYGIQCNIVKLHHTCEFWQMSTNDPKEAKRQQIFTECCMC